MKVFGIRLIPPVAISMLVLKEAETVYSSGMTVKMTIKIKNRYRKNFALALIRIVIACSPLSQ